jgi:Holliday junction resolvasome RuvABC ATP-dependent DNA helicase subunit
MNMTNMTKQGNKIDEAQARIQLCMESRAKTLDLSDIGLTEIPDEVKNLSHLRSINLSENRLTELPDFIGSCTSLKNLDVSYNRLSSLPQTIGNLSYLENLNVRCNKLTVIPESIGKLTLLNFIDISYNQLDYLPDVFNSLSRLEHCNIKGNSIDNIPEKINELSKPKQLTILQHIEQIVSLSGNNTFSDDFFLTAKNHIDYISQKLNITPVQSVLFSHIFSTFENSPVGMNEIANSLNCNKIKLMQYINDFEELKSKKLIRSFKRGQRQRGPSSDIAEYYLSNEVINSLMKNEAYHPVTQTNLSVIELFSMMESLFEQRVGDKEMPYEEFSARLIELLDINNQLPFVIKIYGLELSKDDLMLLLRFCHLFINRDQDELSLNDISAMYDHHSDFGYSRRQFKMGEHNLMSRGFVEFTGSEGFMNHELFKLTDTTKKDLLAELMIKSVNSKEIIQAQKIQEKQLFYNSLEAEQVARFSSLLSMNSFKEIQARLSENNMRTGFACLFYGPPGCGKTETAYQIARQTGRDIMMVDISETKSMWFGESEKKIKDVFSRYRNFVDGNEITPILLINEADAVIGKRKNVSSSAVAQTENAIQNIILQELENLKGIFIATTNLTENMDKAFERRFLYKIEFKKPEITVRQSIWKAMLPSLYDDDAKAVASRFDFSGGQIENIARKRTVEYILSGIEPSHEKLIAFCEEELLNRETVKRIGFAA